MHTHYKPTVLFLNISPDYTPACAWCSIKVSPINPLVSTPRINAYNLSWKTRHERFFLHIICSSDYAGTFVKASISLSIVAARSPMYGQTRIQNWMCNLIYFYNCALCTLSLYICVFLCLCCMFICIEQLQIKLNWIELKLCKKKRRRYWQVAVRLLAIRRLLARSCTDTCRLHSYTECNQFHSWCHS